MEKKLSFYKVPIKKLKFNGDKVPTMFTHAIEKLMLNGNKVLTMFLKRRILYDKKFHK